MSALRSSSRPNTDQDLPSLGSRRPSWILSLSEHEASHTGTIKPRLKRRKKHSDEIRLHAQSWGTSEVSSLDGAIQRARKPRVETEASPEQLPSRAPLPESPEEGKRFRSSWEINVKDLVGDAVGNVCPISCDILVSCLNHLSR